MKKIAVVLSGCGFKDGAEITESVSTLILLSEMGADYTVFAPEKEVKELNHLNDQETDSTRNILSEVTRITRKPATELKQLNASDFDGIVFPGGFGVAKHLCDWAYKGSACQVDKHLKKAIQQFHEESKPICAICIAPALIAKVLGEHYVTVTIGNDEATAAEIEKTGAQHVTCNVDDYVTDRETKVISTPAYMYDDAKPHEVFKGIKGALSEFVEMA